MKVNRHGPLPTIPRGANVHDTAAEMTRLNAGALLVREEDEVIGIVTDRDLVVRAVAGGPDELTKPVSEFMTSEMIACANTDSLSHAAEVMEKHRVRYLLVLDENREAVGLLSIDMIAAQSGSEEIVGEVLAAGHRKNEEVESSASK